MEEDKSNLPEETNHEGEEEAERRVPVELSVLSIVDEIMVRLQNNPLLRTNLIGSVLLNVKESQVKYLFECSAEKAVLKEVKVSDAVSDPIDCIIHLSEQVLFKIARGQLNPQIAMLSEKIEVERKHGLAVYFFNLIAPRGERHER